MSKILLLLSLKRNCGVRKNLVVKRKLRYYKEVINPNLEDQKYLSVEINSPKKVNITKLITDSHELHSETGHWFIPKTPWTERVFPPYESISVEDENHFLLECLDYTHIRSEFHIICDNTNLYNFLTSQNYSELGKLLGKLFEHKNNILK